MMSDGITESRGKSIVPGGIYRHFKGDMYVVVAVCKDSETPYHSDKAKVHYMNLTTGEHYHRSIYGEDGFLTPKMADDNKIERFAHTGFATISIDEKGRYHVSRIY